MKLRQPTIETLALVESPQQAKQVAACLRDAGVPTHQYWVEDTRSLSDYLSRQNWDLVLLGLSGKHPLVPACVHRFPETPFVALLDRARKRPSTRLLQAGIFDVGYLSQPRHLAFVLKRALETAHLRLENRTVKHYQTDYRRLLGDVLRDSEQAVAYLHDGVHAYANPAYLAMTGLSDLAAARRTPALELVSARQQGSFARLLRDLQSARTLHRRCHLQLQRRHGAQRRIAADFSRAVYDGEEMVQVMVSIHAERAETASKIRSTDRLNDIDVLETARVNATIDATAAVAETATGHDSTTQQPEQQRLPAPRHWPDIVLCESAPGNARHIRATTAERRQETILKGVSNDPDDSHASADSRYHGTAAAGASTSTTTTIATGHPVAVAAVGTADQPSILRLISDNPDAPRLHNSPGTTALRELAQGKPLSELHLHAGPGNTMTDIDTGSPSHRHSASSLDMVTAGLQLNIRQRPVTAFRSDHFERTLLSLAVTPANADPAQPSLARLPADIPNSAAGLIARVRQQGLLLELDRWTLHNAASQLAKQLRQRSDTRFYVPINIDDRELQELLPWLARLCRHFRLPSRALNIVLDAVGLSDNSYYQPATLAQLATLNIGIGVDGLDADVGCHTDIDLAAADEDSDSLLRRLQAEDASMPVDERLPIELALLDSCLAATLHTRETQGQVTALTDFCRQRGITTALEVTESRQLAPLWQCGVDCFTAGTTDGAHDVMLAFPTLQPAADSRVETRIRDQATMAGNYSEADDDDDNVVVNLVYSDGEPAADTAHQQQQQQQQQDGELPVQQPAGGRAQTATSPAAAAAKPAAKIAASASLPENIAIGATASLNDSLLDLTLVAGAPAPDLI